MYFTEINQLIAKLRACPISEKFGPLSDSNSLRQLDSYLLDKSYLSDNCPTQLDVKCYQLLRKFDHTGYDNISRWSTHIASYVNEFEFLPKAEFS